ncbi:MAG TPA: UpxY family transcription antiterminator, partial [Salinimicrobium sp.]|nr:UpxY family transcription antiterminator [Salinimicrobium sp.]
MAWYVLYTKPRHEKKVAVALEKMDVEVFCPMITEVRQWSDRKKKLQVPLFKSYVFVNIEEKERHEILTVSGVVRYLFWLGKPAIVRDVEIQTLRSWLNDNRIENVEVHNLNPGD